MDKTFFDNDTFEVHKNQTEFDKYGVWVKKPPRSLEENTSLDEKQEESVTDTISQDTQVAAPQDAILQTQNSESLEELSPSDEDIISLPEMTTETDDIVIPNLTEAQAEDQTETVLQQENITLDPMPQQEQQQDSEVTNIIQETISDPEKEDISETDIFTELPPEFEEEELTYDFENTPTTSFTDAEGIAIQETQEAKSATANEALAENTLNSSIDFDDISEISLDDFMDEPETEKNDIQDAPVIDMDLSFDEGYTENNEDTPEEEEDVPEIPEEEGIAVTADNFDEMFDNLVDESSEATTLENTLEDTREENTFVDNNQDTDIQDFDKFLEDFSDNSLGISTEEQFSTPVQKDYSMEVTFDDETGDSVEAANFISSTKEEEEVVPLDQDSDQEKTEVFKVPTLEGIETSEYTEQDHSGVDGFDIDKVLSEVEDVTTGNVSGLMSVTESLKDINPQEPQDVTETYQNEAEKMENSKAQEQIKLLTEEIAELRREFSALKTEVEALKSGALPINQSPLSEASDNSGGFFDDGADDDNTIALSGDELTNILNTADFTEEHTEDHISGNFDEAETPDELESFSQLPEEIEIPKNNDDAGEDASEDLSVNQDLDFQQETEETFEDTVTQQDFEEPFVPPFEEEKIPSTDDELTNSMEEAYPHREGIISEDITEPLDFEDQESEELDDMFQTPQWNTVAEEEDGTLSSFFNEDKDFMVSDEPIFQETLEEKTEEDFTVPTPVTDFAEESVLEDIQEDSKKPVEAEVLETEEAEPVEDVFQTDQWATVEETVPVVETVKEDLIETEEPAVEILPEESMETVTEEPMEAIIPELEETIEESTGDEFVSPTSLPEITAEPVLEETQEDIQKSVEEEICETEEAEPVEDIFQTGQWSTLEDSMVQEGCIVESVPETEDIVKEDVKEDFVLPIQSSESANKPVYGEMQEYDQEVVCLEENTVSKSDEEVGVVEEKTEEPIFEETHQAIQETSEEELTDTEETKPVETVSPTDQWTEEVLSGTQTEASTENEEVDRSFVIEETPDIITEEETEHLQELEEEPVEPTLTEHFGFETSDVNGETVSDNESVPESEEVAIENQSSEIPQDLKQDIKSVLVYMDQLLDSLPEEKIAEFARSEHFELYKKLFNELGLS